MRFPKELKQVLDDTGLPWRIENGSKHHKIILDGRFVSIIPREFRQEANKRSTLNVIKNVRHMAKKIREETQ